MNTENIIKEWSAQTQDNGLNEKLATYKAMMDATTDEGQKACYAELISYVQKDIAQSAIRTTTTKQQEILDVLNAMPEEWLKNLSYLAIYKGADKKWAMRKSTAVIK